MYLAYVVRPDGGRPGRGPSELPLSDLFHTYGLRGGFGIQLLTVGLLIINAIINGDIGSIYEILDGHSEVTSNTSIAMVLVTMMVAGAALLAGFRNAIDDDASILHSRGFRSGTKALSTASILDLICWTLSFFVIYSQMTYAKSDESVAATSMISLFARLVHIAALIFYSGAIFLLEVYHISGVGEAWGWLNTMSFKAVAVLEISMLFVPSRGIGLAASVMYFGTLLSTFIWALSFEDLLISNEVSMNQSHFRNEHYRSKNALSYYGPTVAQGQAGMV